ncbi:hypothetical protein KCP78_05860 [Salmonella enterica subsp. enterica]|nr:hypothetical protein KCP78_05860 [Salmonella enterica subsp. enterica]
MPHFVSGALKQVLPAGAISDLPDGETVGGDTADLSEDMRSTMDKGAQEIMALLARAGRWP